jgi:N-acetylneuraminate lyase
MKKIEGLIAATHTPMNSDGSINFNIIPDYFQFLKRNKIRGIFLNGSTSEGYHLTTEERKQTVEVWTKAAGGSDFKIFVFVGHLATRDACDMAEHAAGFGNVHGIAATAPFYQKPATVQLLADLCAEIASAAPGKPFYYYHIPVLTQVSIPMTEFLQVAANKIPSLAGVKYTHNDLEDFMLSMDIGHGKFDMLAGIDEIALASKAIGAKGFIGSTYNFMAPLFLSMFEAFDRGNHEQARELQKSAIRIIRAIAPYGFISACKVIMKELGIDNGQVRLPSRQITENEKIKLMKELSHLNFNSIACS